MKKFWIKFLVALVCLAALAASCPAAEENNVAIAASIAPAFEDLVKAFAESGGAKMTVVAGASGKLAAQIEQGAPYVLFVSANEKWAAYLAEKGLLSEKRVVATSPLVLWWTKDTPPSLDALRDPKILVAIADPAVAPLGVAAQEYLKKEGLYETLESAKRLVVAGDILAATLAVKSKGADVAFIALGTARKVGGAWTEIPSASQTYVGGLLGATPTENAKAFWAFLAGEKAAEILKNTGFEPAGK